MQEYSVLVRSLINENGSLWDQRFSRVRILPTTTCVLQLKLRPAQLGAKKQLAFDLVKEWIDIEDWIRLRTVSHELLELFHTQNSCWARGAKTRKGWRIRGDLSAFEDVCFRVRATQEISKAWNDLLDFADRPMVTWSFRPGATERELQRFEDAHELTLPYQARACFEMHDGQEEREAIGQQFPRLLSLKEVAARLEDPFLSTTFSKAIAGRALIPLFEGDTCVDVDTGEICFTSGGLASRVIVVARSLAAYLNVA